jgi:hypothetical protein
MITPMETETIPGQVTDITEYTDRELLNYIVEEITALRESHNNILVMVAEIKNAVEPTLNALKESPIMRMMGVKSND